MADPLRSEPPVNSRPKVRPHPEDTLSVLEAVRDVNEGKLQAIDRKALEHWAETGEWPESFS